jgi:allophanate hydrolase subunit 2
MGYRLKGAPIKSDRKGIVSQGISVGAIQLPQDGQPIVLMKDRQTIGGYPQLGCIAYLDLCLLSQSRPGATVSFEAVDMSELEGELISYMSFFDVSY